MFYQKNGVIVPQDIVSNEDRAFLYGDGCFTTARLSNGKVLLWQRHLDRLQEAMIKLCLNCNIESIKNEKEVFLEHIQSHSNGVIKILLSRGVGKRGYLLPKQPCDIYFYFYPDHQQIAHPLNLNVVGQIDEPLGTSMDRLRGIKTLNRLEQVMLKNIATEYRWDEAVCVDMQNNIVEGISSNCFLFIDGYWVTPDLALAGINGIMRQEILHRMLQYNIPHKTRKIHVTEIKNVQAGFFCNALSPMQMISVLQDRQLATDICEVLFSSLFLEQLV